MKIRTLMAANLSLLLLLSVSAQAAEESARFYARSGSKLRMEGTSNIHDWQVESSLIGGYFEAGPNFPVEPGQAAAPGKYEAKAEPFVMVRSLKSIEKDGKPYSDRMDEVMYEHLKAQSDPRARITFRLTSLTLKEAAKSKEAPYVFDAKGDLVVAGVTNQVAFPVNILPLGDKKLKISGSGAVKMSDFKIDPPAPKIALGMIKTGDEVKLIFEWVVGQRTAAAAAK